MSSSPKTPLTFFNTATRQKEILQPIKAGNISMYTCGPTVYDFAHIGNFRTYVFEDILRRTLKFFGLKVTQVMNLTDIDDKTIRGAIAKGIPLGEYTKKYSDAFFEDIKTLNIEPAEHYPAATSYIKEMCAVIQKLLDKGIAYKSNDGSVYFAIKKFPHYGCLSHLDLDSLEAGASDRVAADEYDKEHVSDFVLWKAYDPSRDGNIFWESPFGKGRPGWHLECSTMAMNLLGETIDIHVGGIDNMFPHHENEIAQSEAYSDKPFVKLWMHAEHLVVDNKKMSKSLGNFFTLRDLILKGYTGKQVRYMLLHTHYKTQLNFTFEGLEASGVALQRLNDFIQRMQEIQKNGNGIKNSENFVTPIIEKTSHQFEVSLADDLNISACLASLFDMVREINSLADAGKINPEQAQNVLDFMHSIDKVLGVLTFEEEEVFPEPIVKAFEERLEARKEKNWKLADSLRDFIYKEGYQIEDTAKGARLKKTLTHKK
jgi:cysteinyl-tRNA synthetase